MPILDSLNRLLGDYNKKELKKLWPVVDLVRKKRDDPAIKALTLVDLPTKTEEMKARVQAGETLDAILPEAFAVLIRACELLQGHSIEIGRQTFTWDMIPFDVQVLGGVALHRGSIAEMKTGEGKTLVCTLPVYLNALSGKGVHVVTVNDYLAKRDATWMGELYKALGLTVGNVIHDLTTEERRAAYAADITYGTNNEYGFDYLRDNMASSVAHQVQRGLNFAIVDEVDSILIDEARTPLIISQPAAESTTKYMQYARMVGGLKDNDHYTRDEKQKTAILTEEGIKTMEKMLGVDNIYTERGFEEVHHIEQALRAHAMYQKDVDYVVKEGEVIIVDEFTGRLMPGRRYSHGLHQAIEAKEGVEVQRESRTLATITFQNYFRLYKKLSGMTGTAKTEEEEFESIYRLRTIVIPTHRPMIRTDQTDAVYRTTPAKFKAVVKMAKEKYEKGQPVLIGTTSIEKSEVLSAMLEQEKVPHQVLNAKQHEKEAEIVAKAGEKGSITIATNMAGRGTDIKLGPGAKELGGLVIIGTERHEARRIDNQLRGRSGRQGDPGESLFFVSMDDELMRLFGGDRLKSMMERLKVPDDVPLQNGMVSRSIEGAQKRVEGHNFDIRRHVLQYDDVMNKHREIIYTRRQKILTKIAEGEGGDRKEIGESSALHQDILAGIETEVRAIVTLSTQGNDSDKWDIQTMHASLAGLHPEIGVLLSEDMLKKEQDADLLAEKATKAALAFYKGKCVKEDATIVAQAERIVTLRAIDTHWMDHIDDMAHLREQVAFAGFAQRDPLVEYQDQGFRRFQLLIANINATMVRILLGADFKEFLPRVLQQAEAELQDMQTNAAQIEGALATGVDVAQLVRAQGGEAPPSAAAPKPSGTRSASFSARPSAPSLAPKPAPKQPGRNDPCPCGSGKKFKKCHGKEA